MSGLENSTSVGKAPQQPTTSGNSSAAVQDYLKAIYAIAERTEAPVSTTALAARLRCTSSSVSTMVKRLAEAGLVSHTPYRGVELTASGDQLALETIRNHRLMELFLHETVGMPRDQVHDAAEVLEHAMSERLGRAISAKLGDPKFDPHGTPIPAAKGEIVQAQQ